MSDGYLAFIIIPLVLGIACQFYVNHMLHKYQERPIGNGLTGAECARQMLQYYGITNVSINRGGPDQDFFDPRSNSVTLSPEAYDGRSITATATACHEVGHACQFASGYTPMKIRSAIVPVANAASNIWIFLLLIGIFLQLTGLVYVAIILYAAVVLFQVVTLPVELNASRRAMAYMGEIGLSAQDRKGAFSVLKACAYTYLVAALTSILQLLWLLSQTRD